MVESGVLKSKNGLARVRRAAYHRSQGYSSSTGGVCEPALVELRNGELYMLLRTGTNFLDESRSHDN